VPYNTVLEDTNIQCEPVAALTKNSLNLFGIVHYRHQFPNSIASMTCSNSARFGIDIYFLHALFIRHEWLVINVGTVANTRQLWSAGQVVAAVFAAY
jgi:hypothetical protein